MPRLLLDQGANKQLVKLSKKNPSIAERFEKTKITFNSDHKHPSLDFKKHQGIEKVWKICLLGADDGRRLFLTPTSDRESYIVFKFATHDDF